MGIFACICPPTGGDAAPGGLGGNYTIPEDPVRAAVLDSTNSGSQPSRALPATCASHNHHNPELTRSKPTLVGSHSGSLTLWALLVHVLQEGRQGLLMLACMLLPGRAKFMDKLQRDVRDV